MRKGSLVIHPVTVTRPLRRADRNGRPDARRSRSARSRHVRGRVAALLARGEPSWMNCSATLGRTLGFSFAAGINLYATVAILGLASRYGWVDAAAAVPGLRQRLRHRRRARPLRHRVRRRQDSVGRFDLGRRPHRHPAGRRRAHRRDDARRRQPDRSRASSALLGGTLAAGTHFSKAGTRAVANTSPEPFSNWVLSLAEDVFVIGLATLALKYPVAAAIVVIVGVVLMIAVRDLDRAGAQRRWRRARRPDLVAHAPMRVRISTEHGARSLTET